MSNKPRKDNWVFEIVKDTLEASVSYWLQVKYTGYNSIASERNEFYKTEEEVKAAKVKLIKAIHKEGWLNITYRVWNVKELFIFASQIKCLATRMIPQSEKFKNVNTLLTA